MLTPAVVHALVAAGATAAMLAAAFEADYNERHSLPLESRDSSDMSLLSLESRDMSPLSRDLDPAAAKRERDRIRIARKRAASKPVAESRDSSDMSPLSLSLDLSLPSDVVVGAVNCGNSNDGAVPVTADWQPDDQSRTIAVKSGQDPEALSANFRDHYAARPHDMRTPAEWQATYRKWARSERKGAGSAQGKLPLVRKARDGRSTIWRTQQAVEQTLQRRESG